MNLQLSCPSKTFLLGEYLVLNEGTAMVLNTRPRFQLLANLRGSGLVEGVSPESPAGQWIRQNKLYFSKADVTFFDPHNGAGGFGASSAQYLLVNILTQILKKPESREDFNIEQIWRAYRQMETVSQEGLRPSGADLVGQYVGGLCGFQTEPFQARGFKWPFADHDVLLVRTGHKIATHEHLRGMKRVNTEELAWIYARAMETMAAGDAQAFFDSVNDYHAELLELSLVAEPTQVLITTLLSKPFIRAAKGCGAMGSDVVALFIAKESRTAVEKFLRELGLAIAADVSQIDHGFKLEETPEPSHLPKTKERMT